MRELFHGKRLLATVCAAVMLLSCLAVAFPVAAEQAFISENYEDAENQNWTAEGNFVQKDYGKASQYKDAAHGGEASIKLEYLKNEPNRLVAYRSGCANGAGPKLTAGTYYRLRFWYKALNVPTTLQLVTIDNSCNWGTSSKDEPWRNQKSWRGKTYGETSSVLCTVTADDATLTGGWQQVDFLFQAPLGEGFHIGLDAADRTAVSGAAVLIDDLTLTVCDASELVTLTLDANGGLADATAIGVAGMKITKTATRGNGYTFAGWYDAAKGGNLVESFPAADATVYAHWTAPAVPQYTVTFHANGGSLTGATSQTGEVGTALSVTDPVRGGYSFLGWYDAAEGGNKIESIPAADTDVYAHWDRNGDIPIDDTVQNFETVTTENYPFASKLLEVSTEENHTYAGSVSLKASDLPGTSQRQRPRLVLRTGDALTASDVVVTLGKEYLVSFWIRSVNDTQRAGYYLATMSDNSKEGAITATSGNCHTLQVLQYTSKGKLYKGGNPAALGVANECAEIELKAGEWTKVTARFVATAHNGAATNYLALGVTTQTVGEGGTPCDFYLDDITVKEYVPTAVTVTLNANGGSSTEATASGISGKAFSAAEPVRKGCLFAGWYDAAEGGNEITVFPEEDGVTAYAHWKVDPLGDSAAVKAALEGKSALFIGDSIAAGWRDEVNGNYTNAGGWAKRIGDTYGVEDTLGAIAGYTFSDIRKNEQAGTDKRIVSELEKYKNNTYDYVILQGGFNDAMGTNSAKTKESAAPIGTMAADFALSSFDKSTYAGGLEETLYYIRQYFPQARVGYIITYSTPLSTYGGYTAEEDYMRAQYAMGKQICGKWGVSYLDLYDGTTADGKSYSKDILKTTTTTYFPGGNDCIHLNSAGYDAIYPYIAQWMATIPKTGKCTVRFNTNGGSAIQDKTVESGAVLELRALRPVLEGKRLVGWYTDSALQNKVESVTVTDDMTLYAKWEDRPTGAGGLGDLNGDGVVDAKDVTYLRRALAKWAGYTVSAATADLNGDGEVDAKDVTYLRRALAKWEGYAW